MLQHISFACSGQIFSWTWNVHKGSPCFCTPKCKQGQLFNAVPARIFPHNLLSPAAWNVTVGDIAIHEIIEHALKFKLKHLTFLSKDHCKWGHPATYTELYLFIFEKVWRWGLGPSGKKISSEIFSSCKLFGMIHRPFRVLKKKLRAWNTWYWNTLPTTHSGYFLNLQERKSWMEQWPCFCDGTLFQNLRKNSCFRSPHREKLSFGRVFSFRIHLGCQVCGHRNVIFLYVFMNFRKIKVIRIQPWVTRVYGRFCTWLYIRKM